MKKLISILWLFLIAAPLFSGDVKLHWDANTETDLQGYKLYWGTASGAYGAPITLGLQNDYTLTGLNPGTYFIAVTAFNAAGESGYSNEVTATIFPPPPPVPGDPANLVLVITASTSTTTATVAWKTTVPTDGVIDYSMAGAMPLHKVVDTVPVTDHVASLTGLLSGKVYNYSVTGKAADGTIVTRSGTFATR
jgi:hypothetical protein